MSRLLDGAGVVYRGINRVRRSLYRSGVLRSRRLPRPVISIGNIAAGGAGKTPAVIALASELAEHGLKVAVLTRGYGRAGREEGVVDGPDPVRYGDEPALIKLRCSKADVIVGSHRYDNAIRYLGSTTCDVFLLDDGFQHLQLARDIDVVIDVAQTRFWREGRSALRHAGFIVPRRLRLAVPERLRGRPLFAFAGLADNAQFFDSLRGEGLNVIATHAFPDHHRYSDDDLRDILASAKSSGAEEVVTTEKDWVKLQRSDVTAIPVDFLFDPAVLQAIVSRVRP